jgi:predicted  nucleic acid-binding Zn-ribbon protein
LSCLSHYCRDCGESWHDNSTSKTCPKCGSTRTSYDFDEPDEEFRSFEEELEDEYESDWWDEDDEDRDDC